MLTSPPACPRADACSGVTCNHRGTCNGGACVCDWGWQGANCTQLEPEYRVAPQRNMTSAGTSYELLCPTGARVSNVWGSYDTSAEIAGLQLICSPPGVTASAGKGTAATTFFDILQTDGVVSTRIFASTSLSYIELADADNNLVDSGTATGAPSDEFVMPCRSGELLAGVYGLASANTSINTLGVICRPGGEWTR